MDIDSGEVTRTEAPVLVLVAGNAHGGTTITNLLIGQHPEAFSAGTLERFPDNGHFEEDRYCSCGDLARDCSFWTAIRHEHTSHPTLETLLGAIRGKSNCTHVVDVTHGIARLIELAHLQEIDLRVIYVQRRLHALANSHQKLRIRRGLPSIPIPDLLGAMKIGYGWSVFPRLARNVAHRNRIPISTVRYEDLVAAPGPTLRSLQDVLGLDFPKIGAADLALIRPQETPHVIRGNSRLLAKVRDSGPKGVPVQLDASYRRSRQPLLALVVWTGAVIGCVLPSPILVWRLRRKSIRI